MAKLSGWGLNELLDLTAEELQEWVKAAQKLEREINKNIKRR